MKEIIYVYTTDTYKTKKWYKIGMTNQESGSVRILQQDGTSNPEKLEKEYEINLFGETELTAYEVEQKIHKFYDRLGKRVRDNREWFEVEGGIDEIKKLIESILDNSDLHKSEIKLKPHQIEANSKINECFNSDDKRCLLAHKPRSGKTFTTIYNIKENNYKNVAILTSYPILNFQWEEVILGFKGFSNTEIIIGSGLDKIKLNPDKNSIVLLSLQDVKGGEEVFEKEKFDLIKDIEFDLLVIDEIHYGVETEKTQDFLNKIKYKRMLGLSATPTRNLLCGRFSKDQIHNYTLVEESKLKKQYPDLYPYADINFLIWNLSNNEKSELKYFSDEEQFKFDKFFRIENNEFYYKSDIIYLFKKLIGDRDICKRDKLGTTYPFKNNGEFSVVKSILLFVPTIDVQYKLKELLSELESYDDFNIHITNSGEYSSKNLMKKIKRDFKSGDKRSLIIAVDQLTTGITLDDCDMVVLMNDWRSIDKYVQASFRCQSPREGKENCWVLDFNAARSFELMWEYQNIISKNNGKSLTENISEWVECVNIFNRVEGEMIRVDFDGFNNEYNKAVLERPRFNYQSVILQDKLGHDDICKALISIGIKGGSSSSDEDLNDDGIVKGKSKKSEKKSSDKSKVVEGISQTKLMEIAKALVDKTMLISIFTYFKYDNIDGCFKALEEDNTLVDEIGELEKKMYLNTLLLGMNDVDNVNLSVIKFIYDNIYDKEIINKKLYLFNQNVNLIYNSVRENPDIISDMLANLIELIDSYLKPSNTEKRLLGEVFTPLYGKPGCIEDQLNLMDESFWKRKDVKVLDPCAGVGNYSVVLVDKFMKGLVDEFPDPEERLKWILEEIIYVNEWQSKNLFIYLQLFDPENKYKMNFNRGDYLKLDIKRTFGVEKFDLICMNPPYQEELKTKQGSAKPLYNLFIKKAIRDSKNVISINPSRWFAGGKGLEDFRKMMLSNKNFKEIIHIDNSKDVFGNFVDIVGGISYCLISEDYEGNCIFNGNLVDLSKFDIIVNPKYYSILNKLSGRVGLDTICKGQSYSGITTNDSRLSKEKVDDTYIKCYVSQVNGLKKWIKRTDVKQSVDLSKWKVITAESNGSYPRFGNKFIGRPDEICNQSYIAFGVNNEIEAKSLLSYISTKFANCLLSLRKISQHIKPDTCKWIPIVPFDREWTDDQLFDYFGLTEEEINIVLNYDKKIR
jgi:site-specific DNA-methyltransferase (adenine-specific)